METTVVDPQVHHFDPGLIDSEHLDDALFGEVTGCDHDLGSPRGAVVGPAAKGALGAREEMWKVAVLDVMEGDYARGRCRGDRDGHGVVDEI